MLASGLPPSRAVGQAGQVDTQRPMHSASVDSMVVPSWPHRGEGESFSLTLYYLAAPSRTAVANEPEGEERSGCGVSSCVRSLQLRLILSLLSCARTPKR